MGEEGGGIDCTEQVMQTNVLYSKQWGRWQRNGWGGFFCLILYQEGKIVARMQDKSFGFFFDRFFLPLKCLLNYGKEGRINELL